MINITTPTLLISASKVDANIDRMMGKANHSRVIFRPHFKTHQSVEIGEIIRKRGTTKITVSSVEMAQHFSKANCI